jgi:hypothetical protein
MREERLGGHPAGDRPLRSGSLHYPLLTGPAGVAGSADHLHPQLGRHEVEHLARVLADRVQVTAAAGAGLVLDVDQHLDPRQVRRQGAQVAPARSRRPRWIAALGGGFLRRLGRGDGLLEVFQAQLELVGVELLRAAAELAALQLPDQEPKLLDLGLRRLIPGLGSITFSLQRYDRGIVLGDDFDHPLCHQQQPVGIAWKFIQRQ